MTLDLTQDDQLKQVVDSINSLERNADWLQRLEQFLSLFVVLAQQLEQHLPEYQWRLRRDVVSADMILEGQKEEERLRLYTQLICPSLENQNRYGYYSISRERRPDLVLEYSDEDGTRFICLDSKYTSHRSGVLESMASAHIYKDSIKQQGAAAPRYSLLLCQVTNKPYCFHQRII